MTGEDIRKLYWNEPFFPFQLVLSDGREVLIAQRGHLSISATGERIAVAPRIEDFELIDLDTVTGVRTFGPPVPSMNTAAK